MVPIRSGRNLRSEMITQILFGEIVECWETVGQWTKVRCLWDNQIGWILGKQLTPLNEETYQRCKDASAVSIELAQPAIADNHFLPLTMGASLPCFDGMRFEIAEHKYTFSGQVISTKEIEPSVSLLIKLARKYLYAPELEGGRSPFGIDSTGLVQILFKMLGINLPRDAYLQARKGDTVDFYEQALPGDLAFFQDKNGHIKHVGILCDSNQILHTNGMVRIDKIDHFGIFNTDENKYTHQLRVIKRLLNSPKPISTKSSKEPTQTSTQIEMF